MPKKATSKKAATAAATDIEAINGATLIANAKDDQLAAIQRLVAAAAAGDNQRTFITAEALRSVLA